MIDEATLEEMFADLAARIAVPKGGAERVLDSAATSAAPTAMAAPLSGAAVPRRRRPGATPSGRSFAVVGSVAAALALIVGLARVGGVGRTSADKAATEASGSNVVRDRVASNGDLTRKPREQLAYDEQNQTGDTASSSGAGASAAAPDDAKIVRSGSVQLQATKRGTLAALVDRITAVTEGAGGYVSASQSADQAPTPTASMKLRVPVAEFPATLRTLRHLSGTKVLGASERGRDVTAQYVDLQAQVHAKTLERDQLLLVLGEAKTIGDILAVRDRVAAVQTEIDQVQGRVNLIDDQAAMSSVAVALNEPARRVAVVHHSEPQGGLAKAWSDAKEGFSDGIEWIVARSGGTLVVAIALLGLAFLVRYLYPVVRRGLI